MDNDRREATALDASIRSLYGDTRRAATYTPTGHVSGGLGRRTPSSTARSRRSASRAVVQQPVAAAATAPLPTARVLREIFKSKQFRLYCTKHRSQNICKHKTRNIPQNSHKTRVVKLRRKTLQNARTQNARKRRHKTLTIQPQYVLRAFGVFSQNTLDQSRKHTQHTIRAIYA